MRVILAVEAIIHRIELVGALEKAGVTPKVALNLGELGSLVRSLSEPAVLIIDPNQDGLHARDGLQRICSDASHPLFCIAVVADDISETRRGALSLIYDALLNRPLDQARVMRVLSLAAECLRKRSAPEVPSLIVSADGLIHYANPQATQLLLIGADERVATHLGEFVSDPEDKDLLNRALRDYSETRDISALEPFRTVLTTGMGHAIPVEMSPEDPGVEPGAFRLSIRPLVPLNELHLPSDSQQRLEALSQLASRVAQELNNPLQFIGDSVTFLQEALTEFMDMLDAHETLEVDPATNRSRVEQLQTRLRVLTGSMDWEYLRDEVPVALERSAIGVRRV